MGKRIPNSMRYRYPLPIHPLNLPELIPHNPVSWAYWLYKYWRGCNALEQKIHVDITMDKFPHIIVRESNDMMYLWENGFFGTGQLSRSEPTWLERAQAKFGENNDNEDNEKGNNAKDSSISLERVTKIRRLQRLEFKKERERLEEQLFALRRKGDMSPEEEAKIIEKQRENLRTFRETQLSLNEAKDIDDFNPRSEDSELFDENGKIKQFESLELMPVEAIFLSFALPVIDKSAKKLIDEVLIRDSKLYTDELNKLLIQYVGYHHYRSHGWCVKSGIKFGTDYLLYKRGPPFHHAEFCIMILDSDCSKPYTWYSTAARVCGGANKTLILCYVERIASKEQIIQWLQQDQLAQAFSSFKIGEVIYRRWVPGRNRD